jgi:hypothetical protein
MTFKRTYAAWQGMKTRVLNPKNKDWASYGGRGIKIHPDWLIFSNFLGDMGYKPEGTILDRKEVDGDYCKSNCRWASHEISGLNRRPFAAETVLRKNNNSGIAGVVREGPSWRVKIRGVYVARTRDFFEACCIRKSFEANNQRGSNDNV